MKEAPLASTTLMTFNNKSSIRIPGMEADHKTLLELLDTLSESLKGGKTQGSQNRLLIRLLEFVVYHSEKEKDLLKKYGYLEYVFQYQRDQDDLKRQVYALKQRLGKPNFALNDQTLLDTRSLLQRHMRSGEKYFVYRGERGQGAAVSRQEAYYTNSQ
jgi:hemerythrin